MPVGHSHADADADAISRAGGRNENFNTHEDQIYMGRSLAGCKNLP